MFPYHSCPNTIAPAIRSCTTMGLFFGRSGVTPRFIEETVAWVSSIERRILACTQAFGNSTNVLRTCVQLHSLRLDPLELLHHNPLTWISCVPARKPPLWLYCAYLIRGGVITEAEGQAFGIAVTQPFELHCAAGCASVEWRSTDATSNWPTTRLVRNHVVARQEGFVCKRKDSPYRVIEKPSRHWIKVKNSRYSQLEGREELFESTLKMR